MALNYGHKFLGGMLGLLGIAIGVNMLNLYLATKTFDGLVTENYYDHGLHYTKESEVYQNRHGWQVGLKAAPQGRMVALAVDLKDKAGAPLQGARVKVQLFRPTRDGMDQLVKLTPKAPGRFEGLSPLPAPGLWDATVEVKQGAAEYRYRERLTLETTRS